MASQSVSAKVNAVSGDSRCDCCDDGLKHDRGYDRKPTTAEIHAPPDQRPWTEYDMNGSKQKKPPPKACECGPLLCVGPTCCIFEL